MIHSIYDEPAKIGRPRIHPSKLSAGRPANRRDLAAGILMMLGRVTAARLAEEASWPHYQASQALKSLWARGRAVRREVVTPEGRYFLYEVKP